MAHFLPARPTDFLILAVAGAGLALTILGLRAWRRSGNRKLLFVTAAFFLISVKGALAFLSLRYGVLDHYDLELVHSLLDFAMALLFLAPFVWRK